MREEKKCLVMFQMTKRKMKKSFSLEEEMLNQELLLVNSSIRRNSRNHKRQINSKDRCNK